MELSLAMMFSAVNKLECTKDYEIISNVAIYFLFFQEAKTVVQGSSTN